MSNKEEKPKPPEHHLEEHIVVGVPPGTSIEGIEKEIHKALSQEAPDILRQIQSGPVIIVVKNEYQPPPPPKYRS
jgi:hypothetical protein